MLTAELSSRLMTMAELKSTFEDSAGLVTGTLPARLYLEQPWASTGRKGTLDVARLKDIIPTSYFHPLNDFCADLAMNATSFLGGAARFLRISTVALVIILTTGPLRAAENQPPVVNITYPTTGGLFPAGVDVLITANVQDLDGSVAKIEFFANGVSLGTFMNPVYAVGIIWNTGPAGAYTLTATATDNSGAKATSSNVNVQVTAEALVTIEAADPNAAEGNPADTAKLTVRRWGLTTQELAVSYRVSGTATPGSDYVALSGSVTIPAGMTAADIVITPIDDGQSEPPETVVVEDRCSKAARSHSVREPRE